MARIREMSQLIDQKRVLSPCTGYVWSGNFQGGSFCEAPEI